METIRTKEQLQRIRIAIFIFYFTQGICFSTWASRIPDIKSSMLLNDATWGTILLTIPLGLILGMLLSGILISKFGSNRIFPIAISGYIISLILVGSSSGILSLITSLILLGIFGNLSNISVNTQGVNIEYIYNKPIMASFHGGWSIAGLVGSSIGLLMSYLDITPLYHFMIVGSFFLITASLNFKYLLPDHKKEKLNFDNTKKKAKPEKFLFQFGLIALLAMVIEGAISDWSGLYLQNIVKIEKSLTALGLTTYMLTMAIGRFIADKATMRFGNQHILQAGGILIAIGLFLMVAFPNLVASTIAFMTIGFGTCSIMPTIYSTVGKKTKIATSTALTIISSVSFIGFIIGPPIIGYISYLCNLRYSYALIGIFGLCITLLTSGIKILKTKD